MNNDDFILVARETISDLEANAVCLVVVVCALILVIIFNTPDESRWRRAGQVIAIGIMASLLGLMLRL